jgi:hypothetical protein
MKKNIIEIGLPCTPSKFVKGVDMVGYRVKMSCGGGMGGSVWNEYFAENVPEGEHTLVSLEDYTGRNKTINTKYVVKSEPVIIATFLFDVTAHSFYGKQNKNNEKIFNEIVIAYSPEYDGADFVNKFIPIEDYKKKIDIVSNKTWSE